MHYSGLKACGDLVAGDGRDFASVKEHLLRPLIAGALRQRGAFDEAYYLAAYPDVAADVASGKLASAADHYFRTGYFEGRKPMRFVVDADFYLDRYPDIARAVRQGLVASAQAHFDHCGFAEGRLPYSGFSLFSF